MNGYGQSNLYLVLFRIAASKQNCKSKLGNYKKSYCNCCRQSNRYQTHDQPQQVKKKCDNHTNLDRYRKARNRASKAIKIEYTKELE